MQNRKLIGCAKPISTLILYWVMSCPKTGHLIVFCLIKIEKHCSYKYQIHN